MVSVPGIVLSRAKNPMLSSDSHPDVSTIPGSWPCCYFEICQKSSIELIDENDFGDTAEYKHKYKSLVTRGTTSQEQSTVSIGRRTA